MKKHTKLPLIVISAILFLLAACSSGGGDDPNAIDYWVSISPNSIYNGRYDTTTALIFHFNSWYYTEEDREKKLKKLNELTADDIIITNYSGSVTKGALTREVVEDQEHNTLNHTLAITVDTAGGIQVKINKKGIKSRDDTVSVYKQPDKSPDSVWTAVTESPFNDSWDSINTIAYGNGKFVAGGGNFIDSAKMAYSTDGITWAAVTNNPLYSQQDYASIRTIVYANSTFIAVGNKGKIAYSSDGIAWTAITDPLMSNSQDGTTAIAYGNGTFVAVGNNYNSNNYTYTGKIAYSTDGVIWTTVTNTTFSSSINAIAYGNNKFVVVGNSSKIATSTDGLNWNVENLVKSNDTIGSVNRIYFITFGDGKFVARGNDNVIITSTDGVTWTFLWFNPFVDGTISCYIDAIAYGNNKFVALGEVQSGNVIAYSSDGEIWTEEENSTLWTALSTGKPSAIAYGNGKFVAAGGGKMAYRDGN